MGILKRKKPNENKITEEINFDDLVVIYKDNCVYRIRYEDFIKKISLGGFSVYESVLNNWENMGNFEDVIEIQNTPPEFTDIRISLANRHQPYALEKSLFLNNYYDVEGDRLSKVVITGGDLSGVKFNGEYVYVGMIINIDEINNLVYTAKDTDYSYQQIIEIDVYDENNIKAI